MQTETHHQENYGGITGAAVRPMALTPENETLTAEETKDARLCMAKAGLLFDVSLEPTSSRLGDTGAHAVIRHDTGAQLGGTVGPNYSVMTQEHMADFVTAMMAELGMTFWRGYTPSWSNPGAVSVVMLKAGDFSPVRNRPVGNFIVISWGHGGAAKVECAPMTVDYSCTNAHAGRMQRAIRRSSVSFSIPHRSNLHDHVATAASKLSNHATELQYDRDFLTAAGNYRWKSQTEMEAFIRATYPQEGDATTAIGDSKRWENTYQRIAYGHGHAENYAMSGTAYAGLAGVLEMEQYQGLRNMDKPARASANSWDRVYNNGRGNAATFRAVQHIHTLIG